MKSAAVFCSASSDHGNERATQLQFKWIHEELLLHFRKRTNEEYWKGLRMQGGNTRYYTSHREVQTMPGWNMLCIFTRRSEALLLLSGKVSGRGPNKERMFNQP